MGQLLIFWNEILYFLRNEFLLIENALKHFPG